MALDNYANLQQTIQRMSKRDDLSDVITDMIALCEKRIDASFNPRENHTRTTSAMTIGSRYLPLPTRFAEMRRVSIVASVVYELHYLTPEQMSIDTTQGRPTQFTVTSEIEFNRPADQAYSIEMSYFTKLNPLSTSNTTNNVLTNYPDLYLYGCLSEVFRFARDEDTANYYDSLFEKKLRDAKQKESRARYGPSPRIRVEGYLP